MEIKAINQNQTIKDIYIKNNNEWIQYKSNVANNITIDNTLLLNKEYYKGDLDLSNWNTSNVTNMSNMFYQFKELTSLNLSNWDVSNVTNMMCMFSGCTKLTSLNLSNWDVSNVTVMINLFDFCSNLKFLDVSNWDISNKINMSYMFSNVNSAIKIKCKQSFKDIVTNNKNTQIGFYTTFEIVS